MVKGKSSKGGGKGKTNKGRKKLVKGGNPERGETSEGENLTKLKKLKQ